MIEENKYSCYISKICEFEINNLPPVMLDWFSKAEIEENILKFLNKFFERFFGGPEDQDFETNKKFPEALAEDFKAHIIELADNKFAVTLFEYEDDYQNDKRTVSVLFKNFNMIDICRNELELILSRYKVFNPAELNYSEYESGEINNMIYKAEPKYITISGSINLIKQLPVNENYDIIKIEQIESMDFYTEYSDEYDLFFERNESMRNKVDKESYESLEYIFNYGMLFKAIIDGEFAGVFAVIKTKNMFFKCFFIREELVFEKFRGNGYGGIFQRRVIESLPAEEFKIISGNIHSQNKASLRTAGKCGRSATTTEFSINLKNLY